MLTADNEDAPGAEDSSTGFAGLCLRLAKNDGFENSDARPVQADTAADARVGKNARARA